MKNHKLLLLTAALLCATTVLALATSRTGASTASGAQSSSPPARTIATALDDEISTIEKQLVDAAEAMPEARFDFSPQSLAIPQSDYAGVRTFAFRSSVPPRRTTRCGRP
jgi:hypothetical protein